ncbi:MAG: hypothetical protein ACK5PF_04445 [bacterium]
MHTLHRFKAVASLSAVFMIGCAAPVETQLVSAVQPTAALNAAVADLRADAWKKTQVLQTTTGVVQHLGDDRFPGGSLPAYLAQQLAETLNKKGAKTLTIKTTDIRLSIPGARIDQTQAATVTAVTGLVAAPMIGLLSTMERNKTASAVLCVSVDGKDFLGNDGRLFAFGAEGELRAALAAAVTKLRQSIESGAVSSSPACEPGWEGGQSR